MFTVSEKRMLNGELVLDHVVASFSDKKDAKNLCKKMRNLQSSVDPAETVSEYTISETISDENLKPVVVFQQVVKRSVKTGQWIPSTADQDYMVQPCISLKEAKKIAILGTGPKNTKFIKYAFKKGMKANTLNITRDVNDATRVLLIGVFDSPKKLAKAYKKILMKKFSTLS